MVEQMEERKQMILNLMGEDEYHPLKIHELSALLRVPAQERVLLEQILDELEAEGKVMKTQRGKYVLPETMNLVVGRFQGNTKGFGFLIPDDPTLPDIFIGADLTNGALHNDRVMGRILKEKFQGKRAEGEIVRVLERKNKTVVGTFEFNRNFGFVVPDEERLSQDIFISKSHTNGAKNGDKVVVEIIKFPEGRRNPEGKIVEILGSKGDPGVDILSIIRQYNLPERFPEEVLQFVERNVSDEVDPTVIPHRRDLRHVKMVTIDGEDAKDLDDAVSLEKLANGNYKLGVYIADVAHYVTEMSPLDKEALKRATSVYLVNQVIPMLPRKLSNGICSLNAGVDRLSLCCIMEIDPNGKVISHEILEAVINVNERMTYTNVKKILVDQDPELLERYKDFVDDFKLMEELMHILRKKRTERGAIDFDFEESKIILDDTGKPIEIKPYDRNVATRIIEEFMLVCNETIAEDFFWQEIPFAYRIHEDPNDEKIEKLNEFIYNFGYHIKGSQNIHPKALQSVLSKIQGTREEHIISRIMLRSLKQARYAPDCTGHFGLAAKYYCHFTSPIRRYPDLIIHRIIKETIHGGMTVKRVQSLDKRMPEITKQCSERERVAEKAERDVQDLKKVEFMLDKIGQEFIGMISGVTAFGIYVELPNTVEGLVHVNTMDDDYYIFNEQQYCFVGEHTRKVYRLGDEVKVRVEHADLSRRKIDFVFVEIEEEETEEE